MVKYFEIRNDNVNVVIDDKFVTPKFLIKKQVFTSSTLKPASNYRTPTNEWAYNYQQHILAFGPSLRALGFDYPDTEAGLTEVRRRLMVFARNDNNEAFRALTFIRYDNTSARYELGVSVVADTPNSPIQLCLYTTAKMTPSKLGMLVYNAQQELVFDALKGYLQHVGTLHGGVRVGAGVGVAATYTLALPATVNQQHLYISQRSSLPFYAAYRISSSGVSYASTHYRPVLSFPNATTLQVQLVAQRNVSGNNQSQSYSGFFENIIYCPYEHDVYTGFGN